MPLKTYLFLLALSIASAVILFRLPLNRFFPSFAFQTMSTPANSTASPLPKTQPEWRTALDALPSTPDNIPAFFFGHGSPMLAFPEADVPLGDPVMEHMGPKGPLATFLRDFGPALLKKYQPKGIVVFSAHWETAGERVGTSLILVPRCARVSDKIDHAVTDYGDSNPLLYDYYGFQRAMYKLAFNSRGDHALSERIVQLYKEVSASYILVMKDPRVTPPLLRPASSFGQLRSSRHEAKTAVDFPVLGLTMAYLSPSSLCSEKIFWMYPSCRCQLTQA